MFVSSLNPNDVNSQSESVGFVKAKDSPTRKEFLERLASLNGSVKGSDGKPRCFIADGTNTPPELLIIEPRLEELLTRLEKDRQSLTSQELDQMISLIQALPGIKEAPYQGDLQRALHTTSTDAAIAMTGTFIGIDPNLLAKLNSWTEILDSLASKTNVNVDTKLAGFLKDRLAEASTNPEVADSFVNIMNLATKKLALEDSSQNWSENNTNDLSGLEPNDEKAYSYSKEIFFGKEVHRMSTAFEDFIQEIEKNFLDDYRGKLKALKAEFVILLELKSHHLILSEAEFKTLHNAVNEQFVKPFSGIFSDEYSKYLSESIISGIEDHIRNKLSPLTFEGTNTSTSTNNSSGTSGIRTKQSLSDTFLSLSSSNLQKQIIDAALACIPEDGKLIGLDLVKYRKAREQSERGIIDSEIENLIRKNQSKVDEYIDIKFGNETDEAKKAFLDSIKHSLRESILRYFIWNGYRLDRAAEDKTNLKNLTNLFFTSQFVEKSKKPLSSSSRIALGLGIGSTAAGVFAAASNFFGGSAPPEPGLTKPSTVAIQAAEPRQPALKPIIQEEQPRADAVALAAPQVEKPIQEQGVPESIEPIKEESSVPPRVKQVVNLTALAGQKFKLSEVRSEGFGISNADKKILQLNLKNRLTDFNTLEAQVIIFPTDLASRITEFQQNHLAQPIKDNVRLATAAYFRGLVKEMYPNASNQELDSLYKEVFGTKAVTFEGSQIKLNPFQPILLTIGDQKLIFVDPSNSIEF